MNGKEKLGVAEMERSSSGVLCLQGLGLGLACKRGREQRREVGQAQGSPAPKQCRHVEMKC